MTPQEFKEAELAEQRHQLLDWDEDAACCPPGMGGCVACPPKDEDGCRD